ncbi:MAG: tripartite tricarboxylate transporter substrate binding protein [Rhodospirillaceae bacterium]|jgi:putative tricarboxylic transport membrane protein|nr:tripartite tricarboxylate transporter substrate binding protein [Rhodospirillaceae bacterium]
MRKILSIGLGLMLTGMLAGPTVAADYPSRPITFMTMTQPGAQIDRLTRGLSQRFSKILGQPINVKNITGSHGTVMATSLSRSKADGYSIGVTSLTAYTYALHHAKLTYKMSDFDYLTLVALNSSGFIAKADAPWKTLKEAFAWARKNNNSTMPAMFHGADDRDALMRMAKKEGVKLALVPSKGGPSVIKAVTGGHVKIGYVGAILYKFVEAGKIKLIAAALGNRLPPIPDVPTLKEQGYDEQVEMIVALVAPKGIDKNAKAKLLAAADKLAKDPETKTFITKNLLMRPVKWGEGHADQTVKDLYKTFGEQAKK